MKLVNKILLEEVKNNSRKLFWIVFLMLLVIGFDTIAPWPFKLLVDNVFNPTPLDLTGFWSFLQKFAHSRALLGFFAVFVYFISTFAQSILEYSKSTYIKSVIKNLIGDFSKKAFASLESLAIGFYNRQQIGDYIYRLSYDTSALGEFLEEGLLPLVTSTLYLIVTIIIMLYINVTLTLISLAALPFLTFGLYSFNAYINYATKRSERFGSATFSFIEEALTHLKIIQAFSQERRESRSFGGKIDTSLKSDIVAYRLDFLLTLLIGVVVAISYSFVILYGIWAVFSGMLTAGLLIVFIFYLDNLTNPLLSIIYSVTTIRQSYVKISRMEDFFSKKTHLIASAESITEITNPEITFKHVSLNGKKHSGKIINNVSFKIERGKRTVIFGVSGSGKTSIINLILRFIDRPSEGKIYLGKFELNAYNLKTLRDNIAFVPQEITLFNDTIYNNIAFGNPGCSRHDIEHAAKLAAATEFIHKLPGGYKFSVGEGGNFLSGGQKQRLMLARALLKKDAKILLFDETLSALDVKTREEIISNIYKFSKGKTTLIISNIFAIARAADNVIVLDHGKLAYAGSSSRLPKERSLYKIIMRSERESTYYENQA